VWHPHPHTWIQQSGVSVPFFLESSSFLLSPTLSCSEATMGRPPPRAALAWTILFLLLGTWAGEGGRGLNRGPGSLCVSGNVSACGGLVDVTTCGLWWVEAWSTWHRWQWIWVGWILRGALLLPAVVWMGLRTPVHAEVWGSL
jgi:hypothetical protein